MDWLAKQIAAKKMIDKVGVSMQVIKSVTSGAYNATLDAYTSSLVTFNTIGVIANQKEKTAAGYMARTNKVKLILAAAGLPTLDEISFVILCGSKRWIPDGEDAVDPLRPGGTRIIYQVNVK
jgi:hypothetical protein